MTDNLKTLKDIPNVAPRILKDLIKQEAIKWVKERNLHHHQNCDAKICWLKFFNLTEEDLK